MVVMESGVCSGSGPAAAAAAPEASSAAAAAASGHHRSWYADGGGGGGGANCAPAAGSATQQEDLTDAYFKGQNAYFSQMQGAYQGMSHGAIVETETLVVSCVLISSFFSPQPLSQLR